MLGVIIYTKQTLITRKLYTIRSWIYQYHLFWVMFETIQEVKTIDKSEILL